MGEIVSGARNITQICAGMRTCRSAFVTSGACASKFSSYGLVGAVVIWEVFKALAPSLSRGKVGGGEEREMSAKRGRLSGFRTASALR